MWTFASIFLLVVAGLFVLSLRPVQTLLYNAMIILTFVFVVSLISIVIWLAVSGQG